MNWKLERKKYYGVFLLLFVVISFGFEDEGYIVYIRDWVRRRRRGKISGEIFDVAIDKVNFDLGLYKGLVCIFFSEI